MEEYLYNEEPISQIEASDEKKLRKLKNHIVVCGIHSSIYHFILPLRAKYLKTYLQDIVIITPTEVVPNNIWDSISHFQKIFLIYGSCLDRNILRKARIHKADKAVILSMDPTLTKQKSEISDQMLDASNIFIYKAIKRCNSTIQILTELSYQTNIEFLQAKKLEGLDYTFQRLFTAGEVYISSIIDTLTA